MVEFVIKNSGKREKFDASKMVTWVEESSVYGCDWSDILKNAFNKLPSICKTKDLHDALIKACLDKEDEPHLLMAGRLYMGFVYKRCYGGIDNIPKLKDFYKDMVSLGYWADMGYSDDELESYEHLLDHSKDLVLNYPQAKQIVGKYSAKNRVTKQLLETPQFSYMRMALGSSFNDPEDIRKRDIPNFFKEFSTAINNPTPDWVNLGTNNKSNASCCLFDYGDAIDSLAAGMTIAFKMTAASAGLGDMLFTRSARDPVRGGTVSHNGKFPYLRLIQENTRANMQGARAGAVTTSVCVLDPEIFDLLRARNPKTAEKKKVANIDYSFSTNKSFEDRARENKDWMLVSQYYAPKLWEYFFDGDPTRFEEEYGRVLEDKDIPKNIVSARKILETHLVNEQETGRQYETAITNINRHTPLKEPIHHSNLCQEIMEHTRPYDHVCELYEYKETSGEIALCNLASIIPDQVGLELEEGWGGFTEETVARYTNTCYYALKKIDNSIENMEYPFPNLAYTSKRRRYAGVGITGLAYEMAMKNYKYDTLEGRKYIHMVSELHMYCLIKASIKLSKERGVAEWMDRTKWVDGWTPLDTYEKNIDDYVDPTLYFDWSELSQELIENGGHRFSLLSAFMPTESSSIASNRPNSIYPCRAFTLIKGDGTDSKIFVAPESERLKDNYQMAWDISLKDMSIVYGIVQKFCDQGISADRWFKRGNLDKSTPRFSMMEMMDNWFFAKHLGQKSTYYTNTQNSGDRDNGREKISGQEGGCTGLVCDV